MGSLIGPERTDTNLASHPHGNLPVSPPPLQLFTLYPMLQNKRTARLATD